MSYDALVVNVMFARMILERAKRMSGYLEPLGSHQTNPFSPPYKSEAKMGMNTDFDISLYPDSHTFNGEDYYLAEDADKRLEWLRDRLAAAEAREQEARNLTDAERRRIREQVKRDYEQRTGRRPQ